MGLDGGTIITRNDILRRSSAMVNAEDNTRSTRGGAVSGVYKKRKLDQTAERRVRWSTCALSGQPLAPPIVADYLGTLYNRQAVLEFLLARQGNFTDSELGMHKYINQLREAGEALEHLTSSRDVFTVHLSPVTGEGPDGIPHRCPVTDLTCLNVPFSALPACGHVLSDRALKQLKSADGSVACPVCAQADSAGAVVPILGSSEQVEALRELLPTRRKKRKKSSSKPDKE